ncbi:MAG: hypothetical protein GY863_12440 [bacterium]|nr:hypothetical protein [bacterium]
MAEYEVLKALLNDLKNAKTVDILEAVRSECYPEKIKTGKLTKGANQVGMLGYLIEELGKRKVKEAAQVISEFYFWPPNDEFYPYLSPKAVEALENIGGDEAVRELEKLYSPDSYTAFKILPALRTVRLFDYYKNEPKRRDKANFDPEKAEIVTNEISQKFMTGIDIPGLWKMAVEFEYPGTGRVYAVDWAVRALEKNFDSKNLRILAGMEREDPPEEYLEVFKKVLADFGWSWMSAPQNLRLLVISICIQLLSEELPTGEGASDLLNIFGEKWDVGSSDYQEKIYLRWIHLDYGFYPDSLEIIPEICINDFVKAEAVDLLVVLSNRDQFFI